MRAIILPLNKFFLNYEKYDGTNAGERFDKKHPRLLKFSDTKIGWWVLKYFLALPVALLIAIVYIFPMLFYCFIRYGRRIYKSKFKFKIESFLDEIDKLFSKRRKDVFQLTKFYNSARFKLFIYYTPQMIPKDIETQNLFFTKMKAMQQTLSIAEVFKASSKTEVEELITRYNIDPSESFFMTDGKIDLSNYPQLNEASQIDYKF